MSVCCFPACLLNGSMHTFCHSPLMFFPPSFSVNTRFAGSLGNLNSALEELDGTRSSSPFRPSYSPAHPSSLYPISPPGRSQGEFNNNRNWNVSAAGNDSYGSYRPSYTGLSSTARYLSRSIPVSVLRSLHNSH